MTSVLDFIFWVGFGAGLLTGLLVALIYSSIKNRYDNAPTEPAEGSGGGGGEMNKKCDH